MSEAEKYNRDQLDYWTGEGGNRWIVQSSHTDTMLAPIAARTVAAAHIRPGERVLDIGCGCGATTLEIAALVGPAGHVTGLDISGPILDVARQRAEGVGNISWMEADAATAVLPDGVDLVFSRFGVMFFGDPVAAFTHIRAAIKPGGRLVFVCWRSFADNQWQKVPLKAAYEHVAPMPKPAPGEPGPFAFADESYVRRILSDAGFTDVGIETFDTDLDIASGGGIETAARQAVEIGAASRALRDYPQSMRALVAQTLLERLKPYVRGQSVMLAAAVWIVTARAGTNP